MVNTITAPLATPTNEQLAMWRGQSQVDGQSLFPLPKLQPSKGIKSPVFHQFNIPSISARQADTSYEPRQTYGIQLKGSSFLRRHSSLNFLRSRSERALFKKGTATFKTAWIQPTHCYLSPAMLFKGVFGLEMCVNLRHHYLPFSSLL